MALKLAESRSRPSVPNGANLFLFFKFTVCDKVPEGSTVVFEDNRNHIYDKFRVAYVPKSRSICLAVLI